MMKQSSTGGSKNSVNKIVKYGENHHWWPICLSRNWARTDGKINTINRYGVPKAYFPKEIAKIKDGHNIILGGPWNETFEPQFSIPDNNFPSVTRWLEGIHNRSFRPFDRVFPITIHSDLKLKLSQCLASLVVRNPTMRHKIALSVQSFHRRMSAQTYEVPGHLIAANMRNLYEAFSKSIFRSGRFAILWSDTQEFIFGDGFLHNFPTTWLPEPSNPICLVPLSPKVSVLFQRPSRMWAEPNVVALTMSPEEVAFCNETVEVYSKDWLYYKNQPPPLTHFKHGEHQEWAVSSNWGIIRHSTARLEELKALVMNYHSYPT